MNEAAFVEEQIVGAPSSSEIAASAVQDKAQRARAYDCGLGEQKCQIRGRFWSMESSR